MVKKRKLEKDFLFLSNSNISKKERRKESDKNSKQNEK
jgi:hypothetical protein